MYYFSHVPSGKNRVPGAYHGSEIPYVFGNLQIAPFAVTPNDTEPRPWQDIDHKLADVMSSFWVDMATTGDPNGKNLPKWPAFRTSSDQLMSFGDEIAVKPVPQKDALDFLDTYVDHERKAAETAKN
jgi:para-nitrobenzyl esterase